MHDSLHTPIVSINKFWKALDLKDVELRELEHIATCNFKV